MTNIIDKIRVSGTDYTLSATSSGGNPTVELTQAEYDALVSAGTVSADTYYIITDAQAGDLTQYWTSAQTNSAINQAVSVKQDTLVSGTNIKTINNESLLGSGNIDIQGGGKAIEAGRGISITTGETADTVSIDLPISADTIGLAFFDSKGGGEISTGNSINRNNIVLSGHYNKIGGNGSKRLFRGNFISGWSSKIFDNTYAYDQGADFNIIFGQYNTLSGNGKTINSSIIVGDYCYGYAAEQSLFGDHIYGRNKFEHAVGCCNVSSSASTTFGDSGNTLFSVGNGTSTSARHNAFEIRQNGDIYITSGNTDVKLQDHLGGTVSSAITSGDANAVAGGAVYDKFDEVEQVTAAALNNLNDKFDGLRLLRLTQAEYDGLSPNYDSNTLYVIVN